MPRLSALTCACRPWLSSLWASEHAGLPRLATLKGPEPWTTGVGVLGADEAEGEKKGS